MSKVDRAELIHRIESLSEDDAERIAPYLQADLDAVDDLEELHEEVARGRESARREDLLDDDGVVKSVLERLPSRP